LSIVGTVCASGSTGPTLALTLCQRLTSRADYGWPNVGMDLAYAKLVPTSDWHTCCYSCKTRANLCGRQSWHRCCTMQNPCQLWARLVLARMLLHAKAVPMLDRGAVLTRVNNCSSHWHTKKVKIRNNYSCFNNCKSLISLVVATTATTMEK
jgi:hypothetical protein